MFRGDEERSHSKASRSGTFLPSGWSQSPVSAGTSLRDGLAPRLGGGLEAPSFDFWSLSSYAFSLIDFKSILLKYDFH